MMIGGGISARAANVVFRDDFDGALAAGWRVVRESDAPASVTERAGFLRVHTQRGTIGENSNVKDMHLRDISGDFILEARIEFNPAAAQQYAGLIVYADDQNAASIGLAYAAGDRGVFRGIVMLSVANGEVPAGTPPVAFYDADNTANPNAVYVRLLRKGDKLVGGYSADGSLYNDLGTITNPLPTDIAVGLGAANGDTPDCGADCDASIPADFDYFQISSLDGSTNGIPDVDVLLETVEITGPDAINAGGEASFVAIGHFSDDTSVDATADAEWTVAPDGYATIDGGHVTVGPITTSRQVTLVATYTQLTSVGEVTRHGAKVVRLDVANSGGGVGLCGASATTAVGFTSLTLAGASMHRRRRRPRDVA
jgi:regulation of enolase protein 1 (concanavalin A-like superfamily)